jgi:hypothetical protein
LAWVWDEVFLQSYNVSGVGEGRSEWPYSLHLILSQKFEYGTSPVQIRSTNY